MAFQYRGFREINTFRELYPKPLMYIHPNAAASLGIESGERVRLRTRFGALEIEVAISDEVREDSVRVTHGREESNANRLAGLEHSDLISGFP
ncbi:MAG: molybdopterin dinucleotide binding domain-containing protein [Deltaproteobacteria bacterium]